MSATFVNVDLEILSAQPLDYLCTEFQDNGVRKMFCGETSHGRYMASFECNEHLADPDSLIEMFLGSVYFLDERAKSLWDSADSKVFDIGYEADSNQGNYQSQFKPDTILGIAKAGATISVTIYPKVDDDYKCEQGGAHQSTTAS